MPDSAVATTDKKIEPQAPTQTKEKCLYTTESQEEILLLMSMEFPPISTGSNEGRLCYTFERTTLMEETLRTLELQGAKAFSVNYGRMLEALYNWKRALARMKAGNVAFT